MMDSQKTEVLKLLEQNIFLPEDKRAALREAIGTLLPRKLTELERVLKNGLQKQTHLLVEANKKNPNLFPEIRNMVRGQKKAIIVDKESENRKEEQVELSELEAQIDTLFE